MYEHDRSFFIAMLVKMRFTVQVEGEGMRISHTAYPDEFRAARAFFHDQDESKYQDEIATLYSWLCGGSQSTQDIIRLLRTSSVFDEELAYHEIGKRGLFLSEWDLRDAVMEQAMSHFTSDMLLAENSDQVL